MEAQNLTFFMFNNIGGGGGSHKIILSFYILKLNKENNQSAPHVVSLKQPNILFIIIWLDRLH